MPPDQLQCLQHERVDPSADHLAVLTTERLSDDLDMMISGAQPEDFQDAYPVNLDKLVPVDHALLFGIIQLE